MGPKFSTKFGASSVKNKNTVVTDTSYDMLDSINNSYTDSTLNNELGNVIVGQSIFPSNSAAQQYYQPQRP